MSEPFPFARQTLDLDTMLAALGGPGWDGLSGQFKPAPVHDNFEPEERLKRFMAALWNSTDGRMLFDWLADLTVRAPPPHSGSSFEAAALALAKHEARHAVGQSILRAIADGDTLLKKRSES